VVEGVRRFRAWPDLRPGSVSAFLFALGCALLATLVRLGIDPMLLPGAVPFITYFPALLFVTLCAGLWAGALALVASIVLAWWFFIPPARSFYLPFGGDAITLAIFVASGSIIVWAAERYRRLVALLNEEEHHRKVVVDELNHRVKNKLATVYALLGRELRRTPEIWDKIEGRMKALTAADDFIARSGTTA
jgi:K+-sensing histidine kinase KdpD